MNDRQKTIEQLYDGLRSGDADAMAQCYDQDATFEDIAFRRRGRNEIHEMWRFVTNPAPKLTAEFAIIPTLADDRLYAWLIDRYTFIGFPGTKLRPGWNDGELCCQLPLKVM